MSGVVRAWLEAERCPPPQGHVSPIRWGASPVSGCRTDFSTGVERDGRRENTLRATAGGRGGPRGPRPREDERRRRPQSPGRRSPSADSRPRPGRPVAARRFRCSPGQPRLAPAVPHPPVTSVSAAILGRRSRRRRHHLLLYLGARAAWGPAAAGRKSSSSASPAPGPPVSPRPVSP